MLALPKAKIVIFYLKQEEKYEICKTILVPYIDHINQDFVCAVVVYLEPYVFFGSGNSSSFFPFICGKTGLITWILCD